MKVLALLAAASVALAAPTPQDDPHFPPEDLIWPAETYRYWVKSGETQLDPPEGLILKNGNPDEEVTTLVNFDFPAELEGRTCRLRFDLWGRDTSEGSQRLDVFTTLAPQGFSIAEEQFLPLGSDRDEHVGRISITAPGTAVWEQSYHGYPEIPCPAGRVLGVEFVGVGDKDKIIYTIGVTGPRFQLV